MDMLVFETHQINWDADKPVSNEYIPQSGSLIIEQTRYTDTHKLSRDRDISIKSSPMSLVLSTTEGKSHLLHLIDTPGHVNFVDEVASAMRLVDGIVLVVDVVEGVSSPLIVISSLALTIIFGRSWSIQKPSSAMLYLKTSK